MPSHVIAGRAPRGAAREPTYVRDPDVLASHLEDAAHYPGGRASELVVVTSEADVAAALRRATAILPIGAQSSLTGGATPMGETLLSTARLNAVELVGRQRVRVDAGVPLAQLDDILKREGRYYPPGPTFTGAFLGGTVSTNAAGAATFKYGTTRRWVEGITVVLASGDVLDVERGAVCAHPDGYFELRLAAGTTRVPVPRYRMPDVPKLSAGYFAAPGMDLIDLFIGSEGTLGVVTEVTLRVLPERPGFCLALVPFDSRSAALRFVTTLRSAAERTWQTRDPNGLDVSAVEHLDRRCLDIIREDHLDRQYGVSIPIDADMVLLVTMELPPSTTADQAFADIGATHDVEAPDTPLVRFCRLLPSVDAVEIAVPGDHARAAQLVALREGLPASVNQRIGRAHQQDPRIYKTAADMIVPYDRFEPLLDFYDAEFQRRGLDVAVWGHISDGNVHPNVIPRSYADVESGRDAILAFGREVIRLGGAPLAEHGVGRNAIKQRLLAEMYGPDGIADMRAVKRALDPDWKLAPGVLFPRPT
jgi:D-lactate dehydrogenase (cytochrome)